MSSWRVVTGSDKELIPSVFGTAGTVLLESISQDEESMSSWLFKDPAFVIQCKTSRMVPWCIDQIEKHTQSGMHAAGFLSYEAGTAWTPGYPDTMSGSFPLLWFGLYEKAYKFGGPLVLPASDHPYVPIESSLDTSRDEYEQAVETILDHIRDGETYQVNYTARKVFRWRHTPWQLYLRLRRSQPVPYGAFINCGDRSVVSLSPELFLVKNGNELKARPMKGTAPRGEDPLTDEQARRWLSGDPKNLAENLMIVDLMRNDLGKVAAPGKVRVHEPFRVQHYKSLFQMTTGVSCTMREGVSMIELFKAAFPPGSVTGAPKINTMRIISSLEKSPRKIYTGAIGTIGPEGNINMNVAIRTVICSGSGNCEMGVGGGIVADSVPREEYKEATLKGSFLNSTPADRIDLFETILLQEDGSLLWFEEHLARMEKSSAELDYPFSREMAGTMVSELLSQGVRGPAVLRLVLSRTGDLSVEILPFRKLQDQLGRPKRVILSRQLTDSSDELLRHKTTRREFYDRELSEARKGGFLEILFINNHGHITEGAFTNLFVRGKDGWRTPDVRCGLLPGIWRERYMKTSGAVSGNICPDELSNAASIVIGNSVRGALEIDEIVDADGHTIYAKTGHVSF